MKSNYRIRVLKNFSKSKRILINLSALAFDYILLFFCALLFIRLHALLEWLFGTDFYPEGQDIYLLWWLLPIGIHVSTWIVKGWKDSVLRTYHYMIVPVGLYSMYYTGKLAYAINHRSVYMIGGLVLISMIVKLPSRMRYRYLPFVCSVVIFSSCWQLGYLSLRARSNDIELKYPKGIRAIYELNENNAKECGWFEPKYCLARTLRNLALDKTEQYLYFTDFGENNTRIIKINVAAPEDEPLEFVGSGMYRDLAYDEREDRLLAANFWGQSVDVFDGQTLSMLKSIKTFPHCQNIFLSKDGSDIYVVSEFGDIQKYNSKLTLIESGFIDGWPQEMALDERKNEIIVCGFYNKRASVYDSETLEFKRGRRLGILSWGCDIDPMNGFGYFTRLYEGDLEIVALDTLKKHSSVHLGTGLRLSEYIPEFHIVFVANFFSGEMFIVDANSGDILIRFYAGICSGRDSIYAGKTGKVYIPAGTRILELDLRAMLVE